MTGFVVGVLSSCVAAGIVRAMVVAYNYRTRVKLLLRFIGRPRDEVRVSVSALLRMDVGSDVVMQWSEEHKTYNLPGAVLKARPVGMRRFWVPDRSATTSELIELRVRVKGRHLSQFLTWVSRSESVESPEGAVLRSVGTVLGSGGETLCDAELERVSTVEFWRPANATYYIAYVFRVRADVPWAADFAAATTPVPLSAVEDMSWQGRPIAQIAARSVLGISPSAR